MKTNPDEPINANGAWVDENQRTHPGRGITKREVFASMAMQGLSSHVMYGENEADWIAQESVKQADALIKALNEVKNEL